MDLSIIIVSYNVKNDLKNCLDSIYQHTQDLNFEVIVVDNLSTDGSPAMVESLFPAVRLIRAPSNLGFGRANNLGVQSAQGQFLLFLNPDTLLFNNAFKNSLETAKKLPDLGAFACRLLYADKSLQPSGGYFPNLFRLFAWQLFIDDLPGLKNFLTPVHPDPSFFKTSFQPDWIMGAFMLVPRPIFQKIAGFDPKIFMYGEELELCYRIKQAGYQIYYSIHPAIIHLQAKSSSSAYALVNEVKGIKYFFDKHRPHWQKPLVNLAFKCGALLRLLVFGIIQGNAAKKAIYWDIFTH